MGLTIDYTDEIQALSQERFDLLDGVLNHAAERLNIGEAELSIIFVNNSRIQEINQQYRDKNQPTDVISFALEEMGEGEVKIVDGDMPRILGDIIISIPKAKEQAEEHGHSFERELGFLTVHGLLHLLGYDHLTPKDEKEMFMLQEELLSSYGLNRN